MLKNAYFFEKKCKNSLGVGDFTPELLFTFIGWGSVTNLLIVKV